MVAEVLWDAYRRLCEVADGLERIGEYEVAEDIRAQARAILEAIC